MLSFLAKLVSLAAVALTLAGAALAQSPPPPPSAPPSPPPALPAQKCVVPALKGLTVAAATRKLTLTGCRLGKVTQVSAPGTRPGRVVRQSARAGATLATGTRISVQVARGRI